MQDEKPTRAQETQGSGHVLDIFQFVAVDEDDVVGAVPQFREDLQGSARDQSATGRRIARCVQEGPCRQLIVGLGVNAGQHSVRGHPGEQGQGGGAQRGTDFDHGSRIHGLGQYGEGGRHTLADRGEPGLNRLHPGPLKTIGDGGVGLGEAPALRRRRRNGRISYVSHTATLPSSMPLSMEALS